MTAVSIEDPHRREGVRLRRHLLRTLGDAADAADAAQETYLRMITALARAHVEHPPAFLLHVARNVALRMKRRRRCDARIFADVADADLAAIADVFALPERRVMARQDLRRVAAAIDELPPRRREVFLLSRSDGVSNGGIAARMGVSTGGRPRCIGRVFSRVHLRGTADA